MSGKLKYIQKLVSCNPKSTVVILGIFIVFIGLIVVFPEFSGTQEGKDWDSTPIHKNLKKALAAPWDSSKDESWPVTRTLALCSKIAYLDQQESKSNFRDLGFRHIEPIGVDSMAGYVLAIGDVAVVVFRGTDDFDDWIVNLHMTTTQTKHGAAHKGFQTAYLTLKPKVMNALRRFKTKHVWITGHSLGGGLAVLCAYDLASNENLTIHGLMTFGQPMVADKTLATSIDQILPKKFAHFVNESDIVPRLPPRFHHCGNLVWFIDGKVRRSNQRPKIETEKPAESLPLTQDILAPLTEIEFEQKKEIIRNHLVPKKTKDGSTVYEGNIPFIQDHLIDSYLIKIQGTSNLKEKTMEPQRKVGE
jgi:triacylglycerol lipase